MYWQKLPQRFCIWSIWFKILEEVNQIKDGIFFLFFLEVYSGSLTEKQFS